MLIGDVARRSGVSARMLRHYERLGLVRPGQRTSGGYREYTEADVRRIFHIESLRTLGLSLEEVGRALDDPALTPAALVGDLVDRTEQRLSDTRELLGRLHRVAAAEPSDWHEVLDLVRLLRALDSPHPPRRLRALLTPDVHPPGALADAVLAEDDPNAAGALRWALARTPDALTGLAGGLRSPVAEVRRRAVEAIAAFPGPEADALLETALAAPDDDTRDRAALALGARRRSSAVPALVRMVVAGRSDVEAAEALGQVARDAGTGDQVVAMLIEAAGDDAEPQVRRRLAQALAEIPGAAARRVLTGLAADGEPSVALTARAVLARDDDAT